MEFSETGPIEFSIRTEVAPASLNNLIVFIYREYIVPFYRNFSNVRQWAIEGRGVLGFTVTSTRGLWQLDIEFATGNPIKVKMTPTGAVPPKVLSKLREDLIIAVQEFEEKMRKTTLYFAWVPRRDAVPEKTPDKKRKILGRIFMGNMLMFLLIFIVLSFAAFLMVTEVFGVPAQFFPLILVAVQFVIVLFSHKIVKRMGDWPITSLDPYVHILQYHIPPEQFRMLREKYTRETLLQMKKEIYNRTLAFGKPVDIPAAQEVFQKYGIAVKPENLLTKTTNVYRIVKEAAARFNLPVPKIMISNVIIPNAAATGSSPRFGLVLLTTGLLVKLDEEEILAVVGHEMSHVKSRDPLALFALASAEYLLRFYFFWNFLYYFGMFYVLAALGAIYFIAKFFEARADLDSALRLGRPKVLAGALRKIGYRRIQLERFQQNRIGSWLGWNPHPPVSFRVERLESLKEPHKIKHPFIRSIKDCIQGLIAEL
ncbi:MAG: M56 family metallopeptidase [Candidatus Bathyarchaeota archaeon]|nr:M56 family metallopeptidase [Candidatus Bathyarchaeota archaeon]